MHDKLTIKTGVKFKFNFILIICIYCSSYAQTQAQPTSISAISAAFQNLNYQQTLMLTDKALEQYSNYNTDELALIYQYRGLSFYNLGQESESEDAFYSLLSLRPEYQLDPVMVSPKIVQFFENIKVKNSEELPDELKIQTRYVQLEDPRPGAGWRSLVLPGWGQIYKDQSTKGYIILSAFILNSTALITSTINENKAHDEYLNATHPDDINSTYDEYNKWHRTRQYLTYSQIIIWAYAVGDAIWYPLPATTLTFSPYMVSISYRF